MSVRFAGPVTGEAHHTARQFVLASESTLRLHFVETRTPRTVLLVGIGPEEDLDEAIEQVQEEAAEAERAVDTVLAIEPEEQNAAFPLIVLPTRDALRRFAQKWDGVVGVGHSGGYYVEGSTIDPDGLPSDRAHAVVARGEVGVMAHEMAHGRLALLAKEQHTSQSVVPAWLDEGIAEQVRLEVLDERRRDDVLDRAHGLCAALVKVGDRRARLRSVLARQSLAPSDRSGYALSLDLVGWLRARLGEEGLRRLAVAAAGPGADAIRLLQRQLETGAEQIEAQWHASLRER